MQVDDGQLFNVDGRVMSIVDVLTNGHNDDAATYSGLPARRNCGATNGQRRTSILWFGFGFVHCILIVRYARYVCWRLPAWCE